MFIKYPEIENSYRSKKIDKFLKYNPTARENEYIYQIKYDGSNIQFCFEPHQEMRIAKRSQIIGRDENFHGVLDIIDNYRDIINYIQIECNDLLAPINLFGEIYGKGIQNRIDYGNEKYIKFFDVAINEDFITYSSIKDVFPKLVENYFVETFGPISFHDIFELEVPEKHEGIVIKPFNKKDPNERPLILKKKNEKFEEKMKANKSKNKTPKEEDPIETELFNKLTEYINHNRLKSVFSKEGEIEDEEQIGTYIKLVMDDVRNEFEKDNDLSKIDRKKLNNIYKKGNREIVNLLKEYL